MPLRALVLYSPQFVYHCLCGRASPCYTRPDARRAEASGGRAANKSEASADARPNELSAEVWKALAILSPILKALPGVEATTEAGLAVQTLIRAAPAIPPPPPAPCYTADDLKKACGEYKSAENALHQAKEQHKTAEQKLQHAIEKVEASEKALATASEKLTLISQHLPAGSQQDGKDERQEQPLGPGGAAFAGSADGMADGNPEGANAFQAAIDSMQLDPAESLEEANQRLSQVQTAFRAFRERPGRRASYKPYDDKPDDNPEGQSDAGAAAAEAKAALLRAASSA